MTTTTCKACGATIVFTRSGTGAKLPLDAKPVTVYEIEEIDGVAHAINRKCHTSHFTTCTDPNRFNKGGKS